MRHGHMLHLSIGEKGCSDIGTDIAIIRKQWVFWVFLSLTKRQTTRKGGTQSRWPKSPKVGIG
jgi:hypothetical protein